MVFPFPSALGGPSSYTHCPLLPPTATASLFCCALASHSAMLAPFWLSPCHCRHCNWQDRWNSKQRWEGDTCCLPSGSIQYYKRGSKTDWKVTLWTNPCNDQALVICTNCYITNLFHLSVQRVTAGERSALTQYLFISTHMQHFPLQACACLGKWTVTYYWETWESMVHALQETEDHMTCLGWHSSIADRKVVIPGDMYLRKTRGVYSPLWSSVTVLDKAWGDSDVV